MQVSNTSDDLTQDIWHIQATLNQLWVVTRTFNQVLERRRAQFESDVKETGRLLTTEIANNVVMIVALLQESNFMRGDVIELDQHTFDRNISTIEGSTVHDGSVAAMTEDNVAVYLESTNLKNTIHFDNLIGHGPH
jgi:hypothetical protein